MSEELNFLPSLTGSFAKPAAENPTVEMVEAAYRHHELHYRYLNTEVPPEKLGEAVAGARAMNWAGFNCSIPHKVAVIEHLDGLGESASVIGAVNCAVRRDGTSLGENTDGKGFLKSLQEVVDPAGKKLVMFGAGGAARARLRAAAHRVRRGQQPGRLRLGHLQAAGRSRQGVVTECRATAAAGDAAARAQYVAFATMARAVITQRSSTCN